MDIHQNYFELFNLPVSPVVEMSELSAKYRNLQNDVHPDRFASKGAAEQRVAVQFAAQVNTAFQVLKNPLYRAEYLLELSGYPVERETLKIKDTSFLMEQMEWRERLSDLSEAIRVGSDFAVVEADLDAAAKEAKVVAETYFQQFVALYEEKNFSQAKELIAKWHFIQKLSAELNQLEERLDD